MSLKRLWYLTLPVFLLVGGGSAAEALTPPYALTATAVSSGQIRLSWGAFNQGQQFYSIERSLNWTGGFAQVDVELLTLSMNGVELFAGGEPTGADVPLDGCKDLAAGGLVPAPVQLLGSEPELDQEIP